MKSIFFFLLASLSSIFTLNAQTTYVPDNNFEQRLIDLGYDDVLDDYVLTANITGVQYFDVQYKNISDLTGLEDFSSLRDFNCDGNSISSIPLHPSVNLHFLACQGNQLTELDLSPHTQLFEIACANNAITALNFSNNTNLHYLVVGGNLFPELDLSNSPELREVIAYGQNSILEMVDVRNGNNTSIVDFVIQNAPNLPVIYVDDCNYSIANWTNIDPMTTFVEMEGQTECEPLGVEDLLVNFDIIVYPNPVSEKLFIKAPNNGLMNGNLYDMTGKLILEFSLHNQENKINIENLSSGIYFLKISNNKKSFVKRIVVE